MPVNKNQYDLMDKQVKVKLINGDWFTGKVIGETDLFTVIVESRERISIGTKITTSFVPFHSILKIEEIIVEELK